MTRPCSRCREDKPRTLEFYSPDKRKLDGLQPDCRECRRKAAHSIEARTWTNAYNRVNPTAKKRRAEAMQRWRARHPEKAAAYIAVRRAKAAGRLVPQPCPCGNPETQAHHPHGYTGDEQLAVEWLCRACHVRHHTGSGAGS